MTILQYGAYGYLERNYLRSSQKANIFFTYRTRGKKLMPLPKVKLRSYILGEKMQKVLIASFEFILALKVRQIMERFLVQSHATVFRRV